MTNEEIAAYHEAGHAVAHYFLQTKFKYVTIIPDEDYSGRVVNDRSEQDVLDGFIGGGNLSEGLEEITRIQNEIIVLLAGYLSAPGCEMNCFDDFEHEFSQSTDYSSAWEYSNNICSTKEEEKALLRYLFLKTKSLIKSPKWASSIRKVAKELIIKKILDYQETIAIIKNNLIEKFGFVEMEFNLDEDQLKRHLQEARERGLI